MKKINKDLHGFMTEVFSVSFTTDYLDTLNNVQLDTQTAMVMHM